MKIIVKGEGPGHPFRGNQYASRGGAGGAGSSSNLPHIAELAINAYKPNGKPRSISSMLRELKRAMFDIRMATGDQYEKPGERQKLLAALKRDYEAIKNRQFRDADKFPD